MHRIESGSAKAIRQTENCLSDRDGSPRNAHDVLAWLTPDLRTMLASLDGVPPSVATAVVQLLPFGSRAAVIALGLAYRQDGDPARPAQVLGLTPLAFDVIKEAASAIDADPDGVEDWLKRARESAAE